MPSLFHNRAKKKTPQKQPQLTLTLAQRPGLDAGRKGRHPLAPRGSGVVGVDTAVAPGPEQLRKVAQDRPLEPCVLSGAGWRTLARPLRTPLLYCLTSRNWAELH